ncbi:hypothetical protein AGMMS50262_09230 [Bacteroidia bacterium]|nr:hypothetical protein AGMMS50262_09230 [Bacteroidia bacterium]
MKTRIIYTAIVLMLMVQTVSAQWNEDFLHYELFGTQQEELYYQPEFFGLLWTSSSQRPPFGIASGYVTVESKPLGLQQSGSFAYNTTKAGAFAEQYSQVWNSQSQFGQAFVFQSELFYAQELSFLNNFSTGDFLFYRLPGLLRNLEGDENMDNGDNSGTDISGIDNPFHVNDIYLPLGDGVWPLILAVSGWIIIKLRNNVQRQLITNYKLRIKIQKTRNSHKQLTNIKR